MADYPDDVRNTTHVEKEIHQQFQTQAFVTRPVSDLIEKYDEIAKHVNSTNEPVFLIKDGTVDLVILSLEAYASMAEELEIEMEEDVQKLIDDNRRKKQPNQKDLSIS